MAVDILLRRHTLLCIFIHTHPLYSVQNKHVTIDRRYADTKRISNNKKTASKKKANHRQIDDRHNEWKRKKKKLSSELTFYIVSDDDGRWSPRLSSVVIAKHAIDDSMRSPPKEEGRRRSREEKKNRKKISPFTKLDSHQFWSRWRRHCVVFPLFIIRQLAIFFSTFFSCFLFFGTLCLLFVSVWVSVVGVRLESAAISFFLQSRVTRTYHVLFVFQRWSFVNITVIIILSMRCCCCCCWRCYEIMSMCRFLLPRVPLMFYFLCFACNVCGCGAQSHRHRHHNRRRRCHYHQLKSGSDQSSWRCIGSCH